MSRRLTMVATGGLIGAAALLTLGTAIAGSGWFSRLYLWDAGSICTPGTVAQQQITQPFAVGSRLIIDLPASVRYQPGEKAEMVVSGDSALIGHVHIESGRLGLDCAPSLSAPQLDVQLSGPAITRWDVLGSSDLTLAQINQPELEVNIQGSGNASATGSADKVNLNISGSSEVRFKDLIAQSLIVRIRGSSDARVTAQADAEVYISGDGLVEVSGNPTMRRAEIEGNGSIVQIP